jgi:hypothetical protein
MASNSDEHSTTELPGPRARAGTRLRVSAFGVTVAAVAMLLWARLILVTGHPRTAVADPIPEQAQAQAHAGEDAGATND